MPKPREKAPWRGPSHHRNQKKGVHIDAPQRGKAHQALTKQRTGTERKEQPFDFFLVIDFECTCEAQDELWPHEIIEFPAVLMSAKDGTIAAEFHRYVRPLLRPKLTPFCKNLTGIQQATVDAAEPLEAVIKAFCEWLRTAVPKGALVCCATDGPTDMERFMYQNAIRRDGHRFPRLLFAFVDVKLTFCKFFHIRTKLKLHAMLKELGLKFEGQLHSGIDDARNIGRLMNAMMEKGAVFKFPLWIQHKRHHECDTVVGDIFEVGSGFTFTERNVDAATFSPLGESASTLAEEEESDSDDGGRQRGDDEDVPSENDSPEQRQQEEQDSDQSDSEPAGNGDDGASKRRPEVVMIKRHVSRAPRERQSNLRKARTDAALATAEDLAVHRRMAREKAAERRGGLFAYAGSRRHWVWGLVITASVLNLAAALWFTRDAESD
jgi:inhibitor of KinA sporulation pathway (predicted exonuclease)